MSAVPADHRRLVSRRGACARAVWPKDCGHGGLLGPATAAAPGSRPARVLEDLLAVSMSEGTLCDLIGRCASNLAEVEQHIKEALIASSVIHQDDTGLYVAGHRQWMHVTCTPTLTHYAVPASRGRAALDAIGILPRFGGTSVHRERRPFVASAATCRRCASRAWICSPLWRPLCAVIPSFLHSSLLA